MSDGFFERWSRRKQQAREGEVAGEAEVPAGPAARDDALALVDAPPPVDAPGPHPGLPPEGEGENLPAPAPTLADVEALTPDSDFRPFVAKGVAPEVKNAAFRKLFADPHFNVMDGLDTYIDDYSKPSPLPESVMRQMASARFLKLFAEEKEEKENPESGLPQDVAQSPEPSPEVPSPQAAVDDAQPASQEADDHHADLRLQPDDAARAEDARDGTG